MTTKIYADQKLLVLVTPPDCNLLATRGELAESEGTEAFHLSASRGESGYFVIPIAPGFHVWEGDIEGYSGDSGPGGNDPQDGGYAWHGDWRPATEADLTAFRILLPERTKPTACSRMRGSISLTYPQALDLVNALTLAGVPRDAALAKAEELYRDPSLPSNDIGPCDFGHRITVTRRDRHYSISWKRMSEDIPEISHEHCNATTDPTHDAPAAPAGDLPPGLLPPRPRRVDPLA